MPHHDLAGILATPALIDCRQVAALMGVHRTTARKYLRAQLGPGIRGLRPERWRRRDVFRLLGLADPPPQENWQ